MQPIPYPEAVSTGTIVGSIVGALVLFAVAVLLGVISSRKKEKNISFEVIGGILGFMGILTLATGLGPLSYTRIAPSSSQLAGQTESVQKEIQKSYGVKLSPEEAKELNYPAEAPKAKFKVFGSFEEQKQTEGKAFEARTVYLVWSDGSLGLSESSDGKSFTPLEPTR